MAHGGFKARGIRGGIGLKHWGLRIEAEFWSRGGPGALI